MNFFTDDKLLTCILPKGICSNFLEELKNCEGVQSIDITNGRGIDAYQNDQENWVEVDILTMVSTNEKSEKNFNYLHNLAGIGKKPGRLMFMEPLSKKRVMGSLEEIPCEKK